MNFILQTSPFIAGLVLTLLRGKCKVDLSNHKDAFSCVASRGKITNRAMKTRQTKFFLFLHSSRTASLLKISVLPITDCMCPFIEMQLKNIHSTSSIIFKPATAAIKRRSSVGPELLKIQRSLIPSGTAGWNCRWKCENKSVTILMRKWSAEDGVHSCVI